MDNFYKRLDEDLEAGKKAKQKPLEEDAMRRITARRIRALVKEFNESLLEAEALGLRVVFDHAVSNHIELIKIVYHYEEG